MGPGAFSTGMILALRSQRGRRVNLGREKQPKKKEGYEQSAGVWGHVVFKDLQGCQDAWNPGSMEA